MARASGHFESLISEVAKLGGVLEQVSHGAAYFRVSRANLKRMAKALYSAGAYFKTCVGSDETLVSGSMALYYIFGFDEVGLDVVLRAEAPVANPVFSSISAEVPAAEWCELEAGDMLGVRFESKEMRRLVLPEDWPVGVYPLRKTFKYSSRPAPTARRELQEVGGLPIGPYHPVLHEPEYFEIYGEGEIVTDVIYRGFHVHRGIEKLAESERMVYDDVLFLAERICGICGFVHSCCYALAIEKAADVEVPERAEFIRSLLLEIERIHSHVLWLGVVAHILGYDAGFMHAWRIREPVMVAAERLTGSRKTYGINAIGGLRRDIDRDKLEKAVRDLKRVRKMFSEFAEVFLSVPQVRKRASGTGILLKSTARELSVVGPVARASGLYRDVRKDYPYFAYRRTSFRVPLYTEGDNLSRLLVRVDEVFESIDIVEQLADKLPQGSVRADSIEIPPLRRTVASVEAPRGENVHFLITGSGRPYRWRVRAPTYQNLPALRAMLRGAPLADALLTIASIDPCFSCTDRVIYCDRRNGFCRPLRPSSSDNIGGGLA